MALHFPVEEPGDSSEDREARALLNKFLGASVIMQGVESMLPPTATGQRLNSQGVSREKQIFQQNQGVFRHNFTNIVHTDKWVTVLNS